MSESNQGIKSEMQKVRNPYTKSFSRETYYTQIKFILDNEKITKKIKVDTGATYTVLGLEDDCINKYKEKILQSNMRGVAYDASGTELKLYGYIVKNFRLTQDIIIDKIKLFFSENIGEKALLGMDILSLFDFQYKREKRQSIGTFWINNYTETLDDLAKRRLNNSIDYIDPIGIAIIDDM